MEENKKYDEVVLSKIRKDPVAFDLQISLFMSALKNYRHDSLLRPFPSSFIKENQEKDVNELRNVANEIPAIKVLSENKNNICNDVWQLLDWITNSRNFIIQQVPMESKFQEITNKTENSKTFHKPSHIFEVMYEESANRKFHEIAGNMEVLYGYHGSRVENFHSILHNGLHAHLNKVSLFGEGTYLSSDLNVSILYSKFGEGWRHSLLGKR